MILPVTSRDATPRRGMLLLLVLSILALFIVVGGVGILLALRARESARAFAAASASQLTSGPLARAQLDEALLRLIRGTNPVGGSIPESLLADKYGTTQQCTVLGLSTTGSAYITCTVTGLDLSNPAAVAGRVLTLVPAANDPTGPTSYRILRTGTGASAANTLLLANVKPNTPVALPTVFPCDAVINGREFSGTAGTDKHEPYDAFDDQNPFLTQVTLQGSKVSSVARPAFGAAGAPCTVDNDGDGVPDGIWLQDALPRQRTASGSDLKFDVSYLVLDLDGRINLNAHGSSFQQPPAAVPEGMGYGPADVDVSSLVPSWTTLLQGGAVTTSATVSTLSQWRPAPRVEATQPGRYGSGAANFPGGPVVTGTNPLNADYWMTGTTTGGNCGMFANSPTDLKARLQVSTDLSTGTPSLKFARRWPTWSATTPLANYNDTDDVLGTGTNSHPYRMRLDEDACRHSGTNAVDAVFTLGELERVLRPFDTDAATLAPRLAALLDDRAEALRMLVTTDSWDTPAITGSAAQIISAIPGDGVYGVHSPAVVAGLRFDVNRAILTVTGAPAPAARQEYFKHLSNLLTALGAQADQAAQWAANVIEFRDPDSIMSSYPNPASGVYDVWGAERPEIVITSGRSLSDTSASVTLYRPWAALLYNGTTVTGTTERIDASLGDRAANTLDVTRKDANGTGTNAVWRLRTSATTVGLDTQLSTATAIGTNLDIGTVTVPMVSGATQVWLERLADPRIALGAALGTGNTTSSTNAYVPVDAIDLSEPQPRTPPVKNWLHWPNRDFVSHGELLAVPAGKPEKIPESFFKAAANQSLAVAPKILDALIVPSRFAGAHVSVASGTTYLAGTGFENFQQGQFSRWREAGRVNVNTIVDNTVWSALIAGAASNPFVGKKAETLADVLLNPDLQSLNSDAKNTGLCYRTPIRLASTATTRSHVFAVWITLRITDTSPTGGSPQFARFFAIVDRSIPVGYAPGRNLNVRETIRLQRFLP